MSQVDVGAVNKTDSSLLRRSFALALFVELSILTLWGVHDHWLAHPQKTQGLDAAQFLEAEVYQVPREAHLVEEHKVVSRPTPEKSLSTKSGESGNPKEKTPDEKNQTQSGPPALANHGPVLVSGPPPVIPTYLQSADINTNVLIEFLVNNQGQATPRLVSSSGNDELDAVALSAVKRWIFRPAEQDHKPIDAKIRLRINFQVQ